jgi:hypothetical protein
MVQRPTVLWTTVPWATVLWPKKAWPIQPRPFGPRAAGHDRLRSTLAWEQHCCLPLEADCDIAPLRRYLDVGVSYLSVNVGYAPHGIEETVRVLASWRRQVQRSEEFVLATTAGDVLAAQQSGRLAVGFDLEDTGGNFLRVARQVWRP